MTFGEYLKRQRETKGWTQPDAAAKAAIEQSYLSKLETGKSYPSEDVFGRLVEAFDLDIGAMADAVGSSELSRLREISDVRTYLLDQQSQVQRASRGWLIAAISLLMLGGACLGASLLADDTEFTEFTYVSQGVIKEGEPLNLFDLVYMGTARETDWVTEEQRINWERKLELTQRLDIKEHRTRLNRGSGFIEQLDDGGLRQYRKSAEDTHANSSPLRWFFVPALAFLLGSVGCFLVSFRWR